jgi:hypothetical protein
MARDSSVPLQPLLQRGEDLPNVLQDAGYLLFVVFDAVDGQAQPMRLLPRYLGLILPRDVGAGEEHRDGRAAASFKPPPQSKTGNVSVATLAIGKKVRGGIIAGGRKLLISPA